MLPESVDEVVDVLVAAFLFLGVGALYGICGTGGLLSKRLLQLSWYFCLVCWMYSRTLLL